MNRKETVLKNITTVKKIRTIITAALTGAFCAAMTTMAYAAEEAGDAIAVADASVLRAKAIGAAIAIGLAALGGALAMGIVAAKSAEGVARQPEAQGKIQGVMMLSLVFIETAIIYALVVAILIIFVL
ncbi:MAG: ATP synthase F0 subunit C [Lachnospiraceae bacterium]|nr:ATP synthase F0 subunit C [Lachnospiraceae bacterium]